MLPYDLIFLSLRSVSGEAGPHQSFYAVWSILLVYSSIFRFNTESVWAFV